MSHTMSRGATPRGHVRPAGRAGPRCMGERRGDKDLARSRRTRGIEAKSVPSVGSQSPIPAPPADDAARGARKRRRAVRPGPLGLAPVAPVSYPGRLTMDLFWNAGEGETIGGVDLLGLRQVDQDLESAWVAGVTTVSIRARYLSLLVWVFAEYYERQLASGYGSSVFDWSAFKAIVGRLEFITLAATMLSPTPDTSGALGKRNLSPQIDLLRSGKSVALDMEALTLHGTYLGPCRAVGLLQDAPSAQRPIPGPAGGAGATPGAEQCGPRRAPGRPGIHRRIAASRRLRRRGSPLRPQRPHGRRLRGRAGVADGGFSPVSAFPRDHGVDLSQRRRRAAFAVGTGEGEL
jgi:hypothetical protein